MATVDELVVKYVLDITGFTQGQKAAADATRKLKEGVVADAKATEESVAKVTSGVEALGRKFLGLYALVTAGRGLREFVSDLTGADSALGRTARNIDLGAKALSTWQLAAEASGGSAAGITGTMRTLSGELQRAALTGTSSIIPAFRALGINLATTGGKARDVRDILTDMNRRAQGMDPAKFTALANLAGISDEGTISMLEMKTTEFDKLIAAQEKYAATQADVDAAQKRQSGWRELLITSTAIGRTILTAVTPALVAMMKAVQDWANGKDWTKLSKPISDFLDTLAKADWKGFIERAEAFATKLATIATAADDAAKGIDSNSTLFKGLEALTALIGLRLLGSVVGLVAGLGRLAAIPMTGPLGALLMNPAVLGTAAVGAALASGDPNKALIDGGRPDVQPQDNDLGLPGVGDRPSDTTRPKEAAAGILAWIKANAMPDFGKAYAQIKKLGFGDRLHDDPKASENIDDTARNTKGILDVLKAGVNGVAGALGFGGVTESSGGLGGSGRHVGGNSSPGASLGDHAGPSRPAKGALAANQKEAYAAALKEGLSPTAARALVANMSGEGLAVPRDYHWDGTHMASGIVQWDPTRSAAIKAKFGAMPHQLSVTDQTRAAIWEMKTNPAYARTWQALQGSDSTAMIDALVRNYENPRDKNGAISTRLGYLKGFHPEAGPTAAAPSPAGTSAAAVTDAEVFAARQRLLNGSRDPKDHALVDRYLKQQNVATVARNDNKPVPVDITERSARRIGKPLNEALRRRAVGAGRAHYNHDIARAMDHAAMLRDVTHGAMRASLSNVTHHTDRSSSTLIANMTVHTQAKDGRALMADLENHLARSREVAQSNSGLA